MASATIRRDTDAGRVTIGWIRDGIIPCFYDGRQVATVEESPDGDFEFRGLGFEAYGFPNEHAACRLAEFVIRYWSSPLRTAYGAMKAAHDICAAMIPGRVTIRVLSELGFPRGNRKAG